MISDCVDFDEEDEVEEEDENFYDPSVIFIRFVNWITRFMR